MELPFTPEQQARLSELADHEGKPVAQFVFEHAAHALLENERLLAAVEEGIAAANQGDFAEHKEVWNRIEETLRGA